MDIKISHPIAKDIDDWMKSMPEEKIVYRCMKCQGFVLPKELHLLKMPIKDQFGRKTFWNIELCPLCFPNPKDYIADDSVESSEFLCLTREQFFITRQHEKAGLIPPDFNGTHTNSLIIH